VGGKQAQERTLAVIGSRHNLKRRSIRIDGVRAVKAE
jgi:ribosomal protein L20A (L18A)